jgi:hypothetical protein
MSTAEVITHQLEGIMVAYDVGGLMKAVLIAGPDAETIAARLRADGAQPIEAGRLRLRLGVALYDRPFLFVPHSVIDESGAVYRGEVTFDWLRARAYDLPRSEVFGLNARGQADQVFAREVDVESSPIVVGGPDTSPVYVATRVGLADLPPSFASALQVCVTTEPAAVRRMVESA